MKFSAGDFVAKLRISATFGTGQGVFKELDALHPALRMARCEHRYALFLPRENAPALIVAIFHERMDLMVRLADRHND